MPRTIDLGRALLVLGAALLTASLFVRWYDDGLTAWDAFEVVDLLLLALAAAAVALAVRPDVLDGARNPVAGFAVPGAVLAIVVVQILNPPPAATGSDPSTGAWLALGAALLMLAGAALALARIAITVELGERGFRHRTPAVDRRQGEGAATAVTAVDEGAADPSATERTQPLRAIRDDDDEDPDRS